MKALLKLLCKFDILDGYILLISVNKIVPFYSILTMNVVLVIQTSEVTSLKRDLDKQKELVSTAEIKIKWNQNKLKAEQDAHKVCRFTLI